jgi:hypothetical protein
MPSRAVSVADLETNPCEHRARGRRLRPSRWYWAFFLGVAACASNGPGERTTPEALASPAEAESFIDDDGTVKARGPGTAAPSDVGLPDDLVRIRCHVSTEGDVFGCTQLRGPPVVEERLVRFLKRTRVKPVMQDGKPVEALRTFTFRITFLMR